MARTATKRRATAKRSRRPSSKRTKTTSAGHGAEQTSDLDRRPTGAQPTSWVPSYLKKLHPSVRDDFARAETLSQRLAGMRRSDDLLTRAEKILIVQQAQLLIEQNYAHLSLKRAMHAVDPVQRFKLLLQALDDDVPPTAESELEFHDAVIQVFTSLRDLHTQYLLPEPWSALVAFLPFMVEDYVDKGVRHYLVSHVVEGLDHPTFVPGVEVLHWNGTPIDRAVIANAERYAGSNRDARLARGIQSLTQRALRTGPPPEEDWVVVGYLSPAGRYEELRFDWILNPTPSGAAGSGLALAGTESVLGIDLQQQIVQRARAALFAPTALVRREEAKRKILRRESLDPLESRMPHVIEAEEVTTTSGKFGYVRIRSFNVLPEDLVDEFRRLVSALPKRGLIIDVRGNGGGIVPSGEYLLQLLTPRKIEPEPVQFVSTPLNLRICKGNDGTSPFADLSAWKDSMEVALRTGAPFSAGFPISDPQRCNAIGQRYFGPVVLITDALCYSTTDIFVAGFQDHEIGQVLGVDRTTGAGGANVWEHSVLRSLLPDQDESAVYRELPRGAGMRVSMRRTLRVGARSGTPVEDLGVTSDVVHQTTRDDVLHDNRDLKDHAGELLAGMPVRDLVVTLRSRQRGKTRLAVTTEGIDRIDVYLESRPRQSLDVQARTVEVELDAPEDDGAAVEIMGFDDGTCVARLRIAWSEIARAAPDVAGAATRKKRSKKPTATAAVPRGEKRTPNLRDDAAAAAEQTFAGFGGAALMTAGPPPPWRVAKSLKQLFRQVDARFPGRNKAFDGTIGDAAHQTRSSDHNPWVLDAGMGVVTACDVTHDPQHGCDAGAIAEAIRSSRDARVKYVIYNRRIANHAPINGKPAWEWRPYTGANPHDHHIHISVKAEKAAYDSESAWSL